MEDLRLLFIGNTSFDHIRSYSGQKFIVPGGSAYNSAIAASIFSQNIGVLSCVGLDYPISKYANRGILTNYLSITKEDTNRFRIDEKSDIMELINSKYLTLPEVPNQFSTIDHIHISCRKGVTPLKYLNEMRFDTCSVDFMISSIHLFKNTLKPILSHATYVICNEAEFSYLRKTLGSEFYNDFSKATFLVTDAKGVLIINSVYQNRMETKQILKAQIVSVTGAGDTFIGSFLANHSKKFETRLATSLASATLSLTGRGVDHLLTKRDQIICMANEILKG